MSKPLSQILSEAADYIDEHGWCQNDYQEGEARCMVGAIREVSGDNLPQGVLFAHGGMPISAWNDFPGRTHKDVTSLLRTQADKWRKEEKRGYTKEKAIQNCYHVFETGRVT